MKVPFDARVELLKTAMQEDRNEVRLIKAQICNLCSFLTVSSFAVTAFLFGPPQLAPKFGRLFLLLIDVSFVVLLWALFARLKIDLTNARKCLQARERLIRQLDQHDDTPFDPFPDASGETLTIRENGLYGIAGLATMALLGKLALVYSHLLG